VHSKCACKIYLLCYGVSQSLDRLKDEDLAKKKKKKNTVKESMKANKGHITMRAKLLNSE